MELLATVTLGDLIYIRNHKLKILIFRFYTFQICETKLSFYGWLWQNGCFTWWYSGETAKNIFFPFKDFKTLTDSAKELWSQVIPNFETFCFCRRHLDHAGVVYSEEALQVCHTVCAIKCASAKFFAVLSLFIQYKPGVGTRIPIPWDPSPNPEFLYLIWK